MTEPKPSKLDRSRFHPHDPQLTLSVTATTVVNSEVVAVVEADGWLAGPGATWYAVTVGGISGTLSEEATIGGATWVREGGGEWHQVASPRFEPWVFLEAAETVGLVSLDLQRLACVPGSVPVPAADAAHWIGLRGAPAGAVAVATADGTDRDCHIELAMSWDDDYGTVIEWVRRADVRPTTDVALPEDMLMAAGLSGDGPAVAPPISGESLAAWSSGPIDLVGEFVYDPSVLGVPDAIPNFDLTFVSMEYRADTKTLSIDAAVDINAQDEGFLGILQGEIDYRLDINTVEVDGVDAAPDWSAPACEFQARKRISTQTHCTLEILLGRAPSDSVRILLVGGRSGDYVNAESWITLLAPVAQGATP